MEILPESKWQELFPSANILFTYENFMKAVARYPSFCGESGSIGEEEDFEISCKVELAAILAHMKESSVDLIYNANIACSGQQKGTAACDYVFESDQYTAVDGQQYYGRGPFMLSYNTNYGQLSNVIFKEGASVLLSEPDSLITDGELSFMSALWYYMYPQSPKPSMHDALLGYYVPEKHD